ncbi:RNA polymerase sigma-28 (SigD/FliA/WhiG) subunit [Nitrosospira sp. Nsp2]|uniref:RNA polymerase sigma factor FliA n=1 Tax=Nitrosospira sp. Nsp2 TaxID=136548 RepID=UPI000D318F0F|nr:RNA polymerase sigma factor FliA [Nitrosospira sp. Nsp2]PTR16442.1 RNA polymerase sigma-28 (SigD/FliA/WhiG) subunit [Nitrosospira sp. Nsp2]
MYTSSGTMDKQQHLEKFAPLVKRIAHHMMSRLPVSVEADDLIQVGMMGLMEALNRYEEMPGAQFETYAQQRIRGAMLDELRQLDWLPRGARKNMRQIDAAINALQQRLGRSPSEKEIAGELRVTIDGYHQMLLDARGAQLVHYEDFTDSEDDDYLERNCAASGADPLANLLDGDLRHALIAAIDILPTREKTLMGLYYEQEMNFKEIGAILGVSESRVCQIHSQAVARLRATLKECAWTSIA